MTLSELCTACGLCCDGSLFRFVPADPAEAVTYERLKLPVKPLADFVLGDLDGRTAGEPLMALIEGVLREHGYSVARDDPFKGVEIIARSGRPAEKRHSLQIEIKRSCYADVERHQPNAGFERVQRALHAMLAALAAHVRGACSRA